MESDKQSWKGSWPISGLVFGEHYRSVVSKAMKSVLPKAYAAGKESAAASNVVAEAEKPMDFMEQESLIMRRMMVGKAFTLHVQSSSRAPNFENLDTEASDLFPAQLQDGFSLEVQRPMSARFSTTHRLMMGQRNQEDPPSSYTLMSQAFMSSGAVLVGMWSTQGNMMARFIKEHKNVLALLGYRSMTNAQGDESSVADAEFSTSSYHSASTFKYTYQNSPQGGAGVFEVSYVRRLLGGLFGGVHSVLIPEQGRCSPTFGLRYEGSFSSTAAEKEWHANAERASDKVQTLNEDDPISSYDACVLAAAFFKPKHIFAATVSPLQSAIDLSYVRKLSSSISLGTKLTLAPPPPNPNNPAPPTLRAKWSIGYEYNVEPDRTNVKVGVTNLDVISCSYTDQIMDFLSVSVNAQANWPKDSYKTGFGLSFRA